MPINPVSDDNDISSALNIARQNTGADPIQDKIGGLNQFLTGLDLEANTPQFNTGIGGAGMPSGISVYHGSPHEFDQFDTSKIGTGEGAQKYGHGLYFAEHEPVAKGYRDDLSKGYLIDGKITNYDDIDANAAMDIAKHGSIEMAKKYHQDSLDRVYNKWNLASEQEKLQNPHAKIFFDDLFDIHNSILDRIKKHEQGDILPEAKSQGHMYEVNIDAHPDHFLDWDKPLSEQSEHVQNAISSHPNATRLLGNDVVKGELTEPTGQSILNRLLGRSFEKSQQLSDMGIKGIRYLDAGSRAAGEGTSNYVVFDPKDIEIMRRYARGGDVRAHHKKGGRTLGNNAIDNALRLATGGRAHFGFGGDTESDGSRPESGQTGTVSAERSAEAQTQQDNSAAARQDAERASVDNSRGQSAGEQMGQMGRGAGEGNGLAAAIGDSSGSVFGFGSGLNVAKAREAILNEQQAPTDIQDYTTQRLNTPYQGSLLSAAMDPSTAFGMGYGSLVGVQNTRAGAAGFLGSAMGESGKGLDPSAINAGSIGMVQETGPRRIGLENTLGIDTSLQGNALRDALAGTQMPQLGYALNEVQTMPDYRETRNAMATGTNAADVADIALQNFERPTLANQIESAPSREAYAQGIMAGRPSGATLGVGQYDAAPSSFRDALMSGIKQADQQKSRLSGDNIGSMLAGSPVSDASNDPAITAARNAAIADVTTPQFNPYAGFSSEDPAEIARYNAAMNAAGPKNAYADMTLGQRAPNTTTNNAFSNAVQGFGNFLTDRLTPSYGINSPEYNKISQAVDVAREPTGGRGDQVYIPPTTATQVQTAPVAPYTTELGTYNQQLPSVGGMTAAQWAAANTAGDMSKVHGRIKYVNGAPMLEYFTQ